MKKIILLAAFVVAFATQAQDNTTYKQETIEFIKITGSGAAFEGAISQIGMSVSEDKKEAYIKEANGTLEGLYANLADLYMKEFTQAEIKELVAFYKTDLGKKLASKQMSLGQQGMMLGQSWGMEVGVIAQKYSNN